MLFGVLPFALIDQVTLPFLSIVIKELSIAIYATIFPFAKIKIIPIGMGLVGRSCVSVESFSVLNWIIMKSIVERVVLIGGIENVVIIINSVTLELGWGLDKISDLPLGYVIKELPLGRKLSNLLKLIPLSGREESDDYICSRDRMSLIEEIVVSFWLWKILLINLSNFYYCYRYHSISLIFFNGFRTSSSISLLKPYMSSRFERFLLFISYY